MSNLNIQRVGLIPPSGNYERKASKKEKIRTYAINFFRRIKEAAFHLFRRDKGCGAVQLPKSPQRDEFYFIPLDGSSIEIEAKPNQQEANHTFMGRLTGSENHLYRFNSSSPIEDTDFPGFIKYELKEHRYHLTQSVAKDEFHTVIPFFHKVKIEDFHFVHSKDADGLNQIWVILPPQKTEGSIDPLLPTYGQYNLIALPEDLNFQDVEIWVNQDENSLHVKFQEFID